MRRSRCPLPFLAFLVAVVLANGFLFGSAASAVTIDWVAIGDPGNSADDDTNTTNCGLSRTQPCGAVVAPYQIGKYEVTNAQYAEFLNAVAETDANALYNPSMGTDATYGGISRTGNAGSYDYAAKAGFESKPVVFVSFWDALRFSNWLHNGQPLGQQTSLTTEDGAYTLTLAAIQGNSVTRNANAAVFLPSENEWYKAAYYDPIGNGYFDYPTGSNTTPGCVAPGADTGNSANCSGAGNVLTNVGAYALSESPNGTFDQGGNVAEWNEQIYPPGSNRNNRGGSWGSAGAILFGRFATASAPSNELASVGFRVASIPEPSVCLMLLAGVAGLATRRHIGTFSARARARREV